jgi:hypothetical protein
MMGTQALNTLPPVSWYRSSTIVSASFNDNVFGEIDWCGILFLED